MRDLSQYNKGNLQRAGGSILKSKKFKVLPLKSETRLRCPLSAALFNTVLKIK